jgi:MFS family permease
LGERTERRVFIDLSPLRRSRDLRCLVLGELASVLGTQLTTVAVPYQVYQLTHSSLDVGLVSLAQLFPLIAGSLPFGPGMCRDCAGGVPLARGTRP